MNPLSGYIELDLNGEILPFKFGTNAWSLFCEKKGIEFYQIFNSGVFGKFKGEDFVPEPDIFALQQIYYFAYVTACRIKNERAAHNFESFTTLMDETPGAMIALQKVLLESKIMGYTFTQLAEEGGKANFQTPA
jgi:hypothetical protein